MKLLDAYSQYNRKAWDDQVAKGNPWTQPVSPEQVQAARRGDWSLVLTPTIPVPREWYPPLIGAEVLCLASGGGQQGPLLAAAGAHVTVIDNSPAQLANDQKVAERDGLDLVTVLGDMRDLSVFPDDHFDLIFHPVSNVFIPDVLPVWREAFRVLHKGGVLLAGFNNPVLYLFDFERLDLGELVVAHSLPYSDVSDLPEEKLRKLENDGSPYEWSHSLDEQIGGQLAAGFVLTGLYEDIDPTSVLGKTLPTFIATRAVKP
ncbi:MAG: class I SAM-dependent methyltransferase [Chloroflexi bacterium]|nr:MAG: class I SAM-dependent methyltransferase [Chloroflexota bacterium]